MATIIIFGVSLLLAALMLVLKAVELRSGKKVFPLTLLARLDPRSEKLVANLKYRLWQAIQIVRYILLVQSKEVVKGWLKDAERKIAEEYKARHEALMGRRDLVHSGAASFYLKKITEHKGSSSRGKIEESL